MKVFVECYNDSALVLSLGISIRQLGHEFNKVNVLRRLSQFEGYALGIIDADTGKLYSGYPADWTNTPNVTNATVLRSWFIAPTSANQWWSLTRRLRSGSAPARAIAGFG